MRNYLLFLLLVGSAALGACSTAANNSNTANMRGTNTNTGYITNSDTSVKPAMPANATNISPPSMNKIMGNTNTNPKPILNSNLKANDRKQ